jgi:hypothetical protein
MRRRVLYWSVFGVAACCLAWFGWRGPAHDPATLISRIDVIFTVLVLAALPSLVSRKFGPVAAGWLPRLVRVAGYAAVFGLVLVKADVERVEYARIIRPASLSGIWVGQGIFLVVMAAYVAGMLVVTARRRPVGAAALSIGTGAGVVLGLVVAALRPLAAPSHFKTAWLDVAYDVTRLAALPIVLGGAVVAGVMAGRRTSRRETSRPMYEARARQGAAAGLCVGVAAALLVSVLGISVIALVPHVASSLQWSLPARHAQPGSAYKFEMGMSEAAAGYLLVLLIFPLVGAGLGAWGGMYAAGRPGHRPGGTGGGGPERPQRPTPSPGGLERTPEPALPALDARGLLGLPPWETPSEPVERQPADPARREKIPL